MGVSAARHAYGVAGVEVDDERPSALRSVLQLLPLLTLVVALAAATVWFVALPALAGPPAERSCEVVFLKSGKTKCVAQPKPAQLAAR